MPYGLITWVDVTAEQAGVRRGNRTFHARLSEVAPPARQVGARVHFDIVRRDGLETAVSVRLRSRNGGGRGGDLAGARSAVAGAGGPVADRHPEYSRRLPQHPLEVVAAWGVHLAMGDLDEALRLYGPDVVVHVDGERMASGRSIRSHLQTVPAFGCALPPTVRGEGGLVAAEWPGVDGGFAVSNRVTHHLITEQWLTRLAAGEAAVTAAGAGELTVTTRGQVGPDLVTYARQRIGRLTEKLVEPVLAAYVKLELSGDPARARPALASVQLDLNGRFVGAHVAAEEMHLAVDLLQRRLADQLEHRERRFQSLRRSASGLPTEGEWQHGDLPSTRPDYFDRPAEERELVRHKVLLPEGQTVDEAIFDMDQLDYGFFLFRDLDSGSDSLVERPAEGPYLLHRLQPGPLPRPGAYPVRTDAQPIPRLSLEEAVEQLDLGEDRFVFYGDRVSGRGSVVYRRYDGHYGLLTLED